MRIVIVHGAYGDPSENWIPWLRTELQARNHTVTVPTLPTPEGQTLSNWAAAFDQQVPKIDRNTIMVGHSIGATFILRLLESRNQKVRGAALVSVFLGDLGLPEFDPINATFTHGTIDWPHVRKMAKNWRIFTSDNDPYVPIAKPTSIANHLGVPLTIIEGGGHLNKAAGFTQFVQLRDEILDMCAS